MASIAPATDSLAKASARSRGSMPKIKEGVVRSLCFLCAFVSVATTLGITYVLLSESIQFFKVVSISEFFLGTRWTPFLEPYSFGVLPLLTGTLLITVGAALVAVPLGLLTAIFLSEYAPAKLRNTLKPVLEILAGVPTVVYGYFALFFITPALRKVFPTVEFYNAASASIVVGIMILPLVSSLCEDALAAVPRSLREAAYGLGATKFEVTMKIVVPAALSGISASFILAISRAVGETMAVTLAAGATPNLTLNPADSVQTMTAYIVNTSKGDAAHGSIQYQTIFAVGMTLFAITMVMNVLAAKLVKRYRQVYH